MDTITLPQSLLTLQELKTLGGLIVAVYVITMYIKEPLKRKFGDKSVRPASLGVALLLMFWIMFVSGQTGLKTVCLAVLNAFIAALVAGIVHDYIVSPAKQKAARGQNGAGQVAGVAMEANAPPPAFREAQNPAAPEQGRKTTSV